MSAQDTFSRRSTNRLTTHDLGRFPGETLFARIARQVCLAGCLPRKEFYETWEVATRIRRRIRGRRLVDIAGGHGLLAHVLLLLDDSSPNAIVVDPLVPPSSAQLHATLVAAWPRLAGRVTFTGTPIEDVPVLRTDLVVSVHACGALTDMVLDRARTAGATVAVLPCCHDISRSDSGGLTGWMDPALAIDATRAQRMSQAGYVVHTTTIPEDITPRNRLLIATPGRDANSRRGNDL